MPYLYHKPACMPRIIILLLSFLTAAGPTFAQHPFFAEAPANRSFYGGFTLGANFSQVNGDMASGYNKVGLHAGPLVYVRFSPLFGAGLELLYAQKGSKVRRVTESYYTGTSVEAYDMKLNYVEVPLMLYYFGHRRLHYGLGVSYARLINSKEEAFTIAPVNLDPSLYPFKRDAVDLLAEVNYMFYPGWFIGLRYDYSLTSIRDAERIPVGYGGGLAPGQYHNLFSLRVVRLLR